MFTFCSRKVMFFDHTARRVNTIDKYNPKTMTARKPFALDWVDNFPSLNICLNYSLEFST